MTQPSVEAPNSSKSLSGPILVGGYAAAILMWCVWFATHLPAVALASEVNGPLILAAMLLAFVILGRSLAHAGYQGKNVLLIGLLGGLLGATLNLLLLGSKLVEQPVQAALAGNAPTRPVSALRPGTPLLVLGWFALSGVLGVVGSVVGSKLARDRGTPADWLARFGIVTCVAFLPLLLIGGLVTSTQSGMAVPDWPNSYGANMFLYPLSLMSHPRIFMEHSHRLFGALVGITSGAMMVFTLLSAWAGKLSKTLAVIMFALVVVQGVLGGLRVTANAQVLAMLHGILAQLTFALAVWLAATLLPSVKSAVEQDGLPKLLRVACSGTVHAYILQLAFGAAYRHLGEKHALFTHIGFSFVVLLIGVLGGALARRASAATPAGRLLRRTGVVLIGVVSLQFILGWGALAMIGHLGAAPQIPTPDQIATAEAVPAVKALVRTLHQANGALLVATATLASVLGQRLVPRRA